MPVFCTKCGAQNDDRAVSCIQCQAVLPFIGSPQAGYQTPPDYQAPYTPSYEPIQPPTPMYGHPSTIDWQAAGANKKIAAGLCGILLGGFGVHKFILGYTNAGIIQLVLGIFCGIGGIIGIIEGIIYLTKSDEEFVRTYIYGRKEWF